MSMFEHHTSLKREETDADQDLGTPFKKFCCTLCGFGFSEEKYLSNHFKLCKDVENPADRLGADSTSIKTEPCDKEIQDTELFDEPTHAIKYEELQIFETIISGSISSPSEHPKTETSDEPSKRDCTTLSTQLKKHSTTLQEKPFFICEICDNVSATKGNLAEHMKTHTKEKQVTIYMRVHTKEKPFQCQICDRVCAENKALKRHIRTHTGEKPYKCKICHYASAQSGSLKAHIRTHTKEKPYKCKICDYAAAQKGSLQKHFRTHTREKPFKCKLCDYATAHNGSLKTHMRTHTGEKPFKCKICDYACVQNAHLIRHMRTHTGEKPYKCQICGYAFAHSSALQRHIRSHSREEIF